MQNRIHISSQFGTTSSAQPEIKEKKVMLTVHWTSLVVLNFSNELSSYPAGKTYMCYILTQEKIVVLFGI